MMNDMYGSDFVGAFIYAYHDTRRRGSCALSTLSSELEFAATSSDVPMSDEKV